MPAQYEAIMSRVRPKIRVENGCWIWIRAHDNHGYAQLMFESRLWRVTRLLMSSLMGRELLRTEYVCHRCDNPPCVNPDHLFVTDQRGNLQDAKAKGRIACGENIPQSKLTAAQVIVIKQQLKAGKRGLDIAGEFGVSKQLICDINHGRAWNHVEV